MSDRVEQAFANLRRGPWNASPLGVPQEGPSGNGNIDSQGWLSDGSVTADVIQANAVIAGKIDADAVTAREIAANTITAAEIAANTITSAQIASNAITADEIAANTITAAEIAANTITASEIAASAITASELAADSVTTTKIVAGNVTSSRIEAVLSGKDFGANSGSSGSPGFFFDSSTSTGMYWTGSAIGFSVGASGNFVVGATGNTSGKPFVPSTDGTLSLGLSGQRWSEVWAVDGSINTSDARLKKDIIDSPLGLRFVRALRPRAYRWRDTVDTQARDAAVVDTEAMEREAAPYVDDIRRVRDAQLSGTISDAEAAALVGDARQALDRIQHRYLDPVVTAQAKRRPGRRFHYGLIAQEVKQALDDTGVDAAFWKQSPDGSQSLVYTELIAPMIAAIQELAGRIDALEEQWSTHSISSE